MFRPYIQIGEWQGWDSPEAPRYPVQGVSYKVWEGLHLPVDHQLEM